MSLYVHKWGLTDILSNKHAFLHEYHVIIYTFYCTCQHLHLMLLGIFIQNIRTSGSKRFVLNRLERSSHDVSNAVKLSWAILYRRGPPSIFSQDQISPLNLYLWLHTSNLYKSTRGRHFPSFFGRITTLLQNVEVRTNMYQSPYSFLLALKSVEQLLIHRAERWCRISNGTALCIGYACCPLHHFLPWRRLYLS